MPAEALFPRLRLDWLLLDTRTLTRNAVRMLAASPPRTSPYSTSRIYTRRLWRQTVSPCRPNPTPPRFQARYTPPGLVLATNQPRRQLTLLGQLDPLSPGPPASRTRCLAHRAPSTRMSAVPFSVPHHPNRMPLLGSQVPPFGAFDGAGAPPNLIPISGFHIACIGFARGGCGCGATVSAGGAQD